MGQQSDLEQLARALSQDLTNKAHYYLHKPTLVDLPFPELCSKINFSSKRALKRLCKVAGEREVLEVVREVMDLDPEISIGNLVKVALDKEEYDAFVDKLRKKEEKARAESMVRATQSSTKLTPAEQLQRSRSEEEAGGLMLLNYCSDG